MKDFFALTKPSITAMSVLMAAGGMFLSDEPFTTSLVIFTLLGTALAVASANTLNMVLEREVDKKMERTRLRPLPDDRMLPSSAFIFGVFLGMSSFYILWFEVNRLTAILAALALVSYVWVYTPLKLKTPFALLIGAVPGAMPPLLGWTAVTQTIDASGLILFAILFLWQIPHFIAISIYRNQDYKNAGIRTLTWVHGERIAKINASVFTTLLIPVSLLLTLLGTASWIYGISASLAGLFYWFNCIQGFKAKGAQLNPWSKKLFRSSLVYLPLLILGLILDVVLL